MAKYLLQNAHRIFMLAACVLCIGSAGSAFGSPVAGSAPEARRDVSTLCFKDSRSKRVCISEWKGRVVLLNLWATWCVPCRLELPDFEKLKESLGSRELDIVALAVDRGGVASVRNFYQKSGIRHLSIYVDEELLAMQELEARGIPTTLLIDRKGREIRRLSGPNQWDTAEQLTTIQKALAE